MTTRHLFASTALALLTLTGSRVALAQDALGGGRALDRGLSTQPGGRINPQTNDLQATIRNNNAIITGNAPGGRSIHAPLGYRDSGDFRAGLATDNLYRFNRDSYNPIRSSLSSSSLYSTGNSLAADNRLRDPFSSRPAATPAVLAPRGSLITDYRQPGEALVGFSRDDQGRTLTARTSALRGLTYEPLDPTPDAPAAADVRTADTATRITTSNRTTHDDVLRGYGSLLKPSATGAPKPEMRNGLPTRPGVETPISSAEVEQSLQRLRNRLTGVDTVTPSTLHETPKNSPTASPIARDPSKTVVDASKGIPSGAGGGGSPGDRDPARPQLGAVATESDIQALRDMNLKLETLVPKGATAEQAYSGYMTLAQEALGAGRYGFADNMFEQALARRDGDVMARVGRIHASMGLGLLSTSGYMLRNLFTDNPEMIGVRYQDTLLMPASRATILAESLRAEIAKGDNSTMPDEAALVLAYLGRQFEQPDWKTQGLAALKARGDKDPSNKALSDILNGAWSK